MYEKIISLQVAEPRAYPGKEQGITTSYEELLSICLRNCATAYQSFALEGESRPIPQIGVIGITTTHPDPYKYILCVRVLWAHIRDGDRDDKLRGLWAKADTKEPVPKQDFGPYEELHHAILDTVEQKGLLAGKVRRSLVGA